MRFRYNDVQTSSSFDREQGFVKRALMKATSAFLTVLVPTYVAIASPSSSSVFHIKAAVAAESASDLKREAQGHEQGGRFGFAGLRYAEAYVASGKRDDNARTKAIAMAKKCEDMTQPEFFSAGTIYSKLGLTEDARRMAERLEDKGILHWARVLYRDIGDTAKVADLQARIDEQGPRAPAEPTRAVADDLSLDDLSQGTVGQGEAPEADGQRAAVEEAVDAAVNHVEGGPAEQQGTARQARPEVAADAPAVQRTIAPTEYFPFTPLSIVTAADANPHLLVVAGFDYTKFKLVIPKLDGSPDQHSDLNVLSPQLQFKIPYTNRWFVVVQYQRTDSKVAFPVSDGKFEAEALRNFWGAGPRFVLHGENGTLSLQVVGGASFNRVGTNDAGEIKSTTFDFGGQAIYMSSGDALTLLASAYSNPYVPRRAATEGRIPFSFVSGQPIVLEASGLMHKVLLQETPEGVGTNPSGKRYRAALDLRAPLLALPSNHDVYLGLALKPAYEVIEAPHGSRKEPQLAVGGFAELGAFQVVVSYSWRAVGENTVLLSLGLRGVPQAEETGLLAAGVVESRIPDEIENVTARVGATR